MCLSAEAAAAAAAAGASFRSATSRTLSSRLQLLMMRARPQLPMTEGDRLCGTDSVEALPLMVHLLLQKCRLFEALRLDGGIEGRLGVLPHARIHLRLFDVLRAAAAHVAQCQSGLNNRRSSRALRETVTTHLPLQLPWSQHCHWLVQKPSSDAVLQMKPISNFPYSTSAEGRPGLDPAVKQGLDDHTAGMLKSGLACLRR